MFACVCVLQSEREWRGYWILKLWIHLWLNLKNFHLTAFYVKLCTLSSTIHPSIQPSTVNNACFIRFLTHMMYNDCVFLRTHYIPCIQRTESYKTEGDTESHTGWKRWWRRWWWWQLQWRLSCDRGCDTNGQKNKSAPFFEPCPFFLSQKAIITDLFASDSQTLTHLPTQRLSSPGSDVARLLEVQVHWSRLLWRLVISLVPAKRESLLCRGSLHGEAQNLIVLLPLKQYTLHFDRVLFLC